MIDHVWNTAEWKTKSKSRRVKQLILKEASKHYVGSITIAQHKMKLEKELKTSLTLTTSEIFELTHTKKGVGNGLKAELVWAMYKEAVVAKYGPDSSNHPIFDVDLWEYCSQ
ncbi:transposase, Ptta/En/Spm [Tanacetum coccineum]